MFVENSSLRIGETLVADKLISNSDLDEALLLQKKYGSKVGNILLGEGKLRSFDLYRSLAKRLGLDFVNLMEEKADPILLESDERCNYISLKVVPWQKQGKIIILATPEITPDLEKWASNKYKYYSYVITSTFDIHWTVQKNFVPEDDGDARELLWQKNPEQSAKELFPSSTKWHALFIGVLISLSVLFFDSFVSVIFIAINIFYAASLIFKIMFFGTGYMLKANDARDEEFLISDSNLPIYTILVPLYKEKRITIEGLINSIRNFDYPKSKLDVKLIVESDDLDTIEHIKEINCESFFEIIRVPYSLPRTKPKACNYAIKFARGEFVTIYDAEDRPDYQQLKKALIRFKNCDENIVCVQAKLNYYNRKENLLTRLFSIEYSAWFNFMLPGLEAMNLPIPLGGTSNHFKIDVLRELYAWDPYNVTEDADLGIRLAQKGYKTSIIDSTTYEEAPITISGWIGQRSRWIKGYMQTYIVHMRRPVELCKMLGVRGLFGFLFFVGAPSLVFITMPLILVFSLVSAFELFSLPSWFFYLALFNFIGGVVTHISIALIVLLKERWVGMIPCIFLFPFYWIFHSIASFKAVWQLITKPHYWEKTEHGLCSVNSASEVVK